MALFVKYNLAIALGRLEGFQMVFWVEIYRATAFDAFMDGLTQNLDTVFFFFQKSKSGANYLRGVIETTI